MLIQRGPGIESDRARLAGKPFEDGDRGHFSAGQEFRRNPGPNMRRLIFEKTTKCGFTAIARLAKADECVLHAVVEITIASRWAREVGLLDRGVAELRQNLVNHRH